MAVIDQPELEARGVNGRSFAPVTAQPGTLNLPTIQVDYGPAIRAAETPRIPKNFASGLFAGASALGEGMQGIAHFLGGVAEQIGKARTVAQVDGAELEMEKAHGDFQAWMAQTPDANAWGGEWEKRATELRKSLLARPDLTPLAKNAIAHNWNAFAIKTGTGVQVAVAKKAFSDARQTSAVLAQRIAERGEPGAVASFMSSPDRSALFDPADRAELERAELKRARQNAIAVAPDEVLRWTASPDAQDTPDIFKNLTPADAVDIRQSATVSRHTQKQIVFEGLKEAVNNGIVHSDHDFLAWAKDHVPSGVITPGDMTAIRKIIRGDGFDLGEFNALLAAAKGFDPTSEDAVLRAAELRTEFAKQPTEYAQALNAELKRVEDARDPGPSALAFGRSVLNQMHDEERFTDSSGKALSYKQGRYLWGDGQTPGALDDFEKIKAFGITKDQAETIKALKGSAKLSAFKQALADNKNARGVPKDAEAYNALSPFTRELFDKALHEGEFIDPAVRNLSASKAKQLTTELEKWHAANPHATQDQVLQWINDNTATDRRSRGASVVPQARQPGDPPGLTLPSWERLDQRLLR